MKLLLLVLMTFSTLVLSQEPVKIKIETEEVTIKPSEQKKKAYVQDKTYDLNNLTTRESRALTQYQITAGVGFDIESSNVHLSFAKSFSRDVLLHTRFSIPVGIDESDDLKGDDFFFAEIGAKLFVSNSLFITPSIFYAVGESLQDRDFDFLAGTTAQDPGDAAGAGLMFTIGNEWRINKSFVIGADWAGIGYNFVEFDADVQPVIVKLINFNVGYAF